MGLATEISECRSNFYIFRVLNFWVSPRSPYPPVMQITVSTFEWQLSRMNSHVNHQRLSLEEGLEYGYFYNLHYHFLSLTLSHTVHWYCGGLSEWVIRWFFSVDFSRNVCRQVGHSKSFSPEKSGVFDKELIRTDKKNDLPVWILMCLAKSFFLVNAFVQWTHWCFFITADFEGIVAKAMELEIAGAGGFSLGFLEENNLLIDFFLTFCRFFLDFNGFSEIFHLFQPICI